MSLTLMPRRSPLRFACRESHWLQVTNQILPWLSISFLRFHTFADRSCGLPPPGSSGQFPHPFS